MWTLACWEITQGPLYSFRVICIGSEGFVPSVGGDRRGRSFCRDFSLVAPLGNGKKVNLNLAIQSHLYGLEHCNASPAHCLPIPLGGFTDPLSTLCSVRGRNPLSPALQFHCKCHNVVFAVFLKAFTPGVMWIHATLWFLLLRRGMVLIVMI